MKLADLEQQIFVPITDEAKGGVTYEMGMSLGEFLDGICDGFKPEVVEAIPVEWLKEHAKDNEDYSGTLIRGLLSEWWKEQRQNVQGGVAHESGNGNSGRRTYSDEQQDGDE